MKRLSSLLKRRSRHHVRPQLKSVYGPQALEDRSLMALVAEGLEFLVNTRVASVQATSDAAASVQATANGDFLTAFSGAGDGDVQGVFARRFNAAGAATSDPILINTTTAGHQGSATAAFVNGRSVIAWAGRGNGDSYGIFASILNGTTPGTEIAVNITKAGIQDAPAVAMAANGTFVVAWSGPGAGDRHGIYLRQFAADGSALTGEILVNSNPDLLQRDASIAMNDAGQFVVTWSSLGQDGSGWGVYSRRFNATAVAQGTEAQVNAAAASDQTEARASMADDGSFAVAWAGELAGGGWAVFARRFAANGTPSGSESPVNTGPLSGKPEVDIALSGDGRYVVTWATGMRTGSGPGVFGQAFLADGTPDGGEFRVGSTRSGVQVSPSVSLDRLGNAVFAWCGTGVGDSSGVFASTLESDRDRSAPTITATLTSTVAQDGTVDEVSVGGTIADINAVTHVQVNLDGGAFADVALAGADLRGNYAITHAQIVQALGTLPGGQHTLGVRAEDEVGNFSTVASVPFLLDTDPVIVAGLAEDNGTSTTDGITTLPTISGTVTDVGAVPTLKASIDSGALQAINVSTTDHRGGFTIPQATLETLLGGTLADGQHVVRVQATDAKGGDSNLVEVRFDLQRGTPTIISPQADLTFFEDAPMLPLEMDGRFTGTGLVYSVTANTAPNLVQTSVTGSKINLNFFENRSGQAEITIVATAPNGKSSTPETFSVDIIAQDDTPTVVNQLANVTLAATAVNKSFNLGGAFGDVDQLGTLVRFDLANNLGSFGLELFNGSTPITAQNFLSYVNNGRYQDSILHRLVQGFIVQGGGYTFEGTNTFADVNRQAEITNEPGISNTRGTIAMAKLGGDPNSATSEWFINLGNNNDLSNPNSLDNQNGGFTAFGRVIGDGMQLIDNINSLTTRDLTGRDEAKPNPIQGTRQVEFPANSGQFVSRSIREVLGEIPLNNYTTADAQANAPVTSNNVLHFANIVVDPTLTGARGGDSGLTLTVFNNSNPSAVAATINNKRLTLDPLAAGTSTITIRATDATNKFVDMTFTVTITPAALMLAGGEETAIPTAEEIASFNPRPLTPEMQELVRAAVARFSSAGLDNDLVSRLSDASVRIADLPGSILGVALADQVFIDADAAGQGWFLDASPADDSEFVVGVAANQAAASGIDMLTVISHELGHVLGLPDADVGGSLMSDSLGAGLRRLASPSLIDAVWSQ